MNINKLRIDGNCPLDDFIGQLDEDQHKSMHSILSRIDYISHEPRELGKRIFEKIYDHKGGRAIGCMFKEKDVRVYCLYSINAINNLFSYTAINLVMGGWKQNQANDTRRLKELASEIEHDQLNIQKEVIKLKFFSL